MASKATLEGSKMMCYDSNSMASKPWISSTRIRLTNLILEEVIGGNPYPQTMFSITEMLKSLAPYFTAAVVIVLSPFVQKRIPSAVSNYLDSTFKMWLARFFTPHATVVIEEKGELKSNQIYEAAKAHLRTLVSDSTKPKRFKVSKEDRQKESFIDIIKDVEVIDYFREIKLKWKLRTEKEERKKYFELSFDKGYEMDVLDSYLDDIVDHYERIQNEEKVVKIYTCNEKVRGTVYHDRDRDRDRNVHWSYVSLEHPATFEKLAMNPEQKEMLKNDLDRFLGGKDLYEKVGKIWKRGYLLYGPPGTDKSSLIAPMANYLKFDIYDLNLSDSLSNEDLRSILLSTTDRSILVIEDIDCGANFNNKKKKKKKYSLFKFTLSGLLNIMDGLWSSCGDQRIIVFTTNHKDRLDPALLRPGRMDMHLHMSYCTMDGFKLLSSNYLGINGDHKLYRQIEGLLENVEVTPAEIAEELLKSGGTDVVLGGLVKFLEKKTFQKAKAAELKELLKSNDDTDVDVEGFVKFLEQEKLKNAKAAEAEQLLKIDHTDDNVELLVELFKQKKLEDAKAAEAKCINPKES